jgi:enoyl-[acyl-carrier protein] reductase II
MTREYLRKEAEGAGFEELELMTVGGLRRAVVDGDVETGSLMAGQSAGMVNDILTCRQVIEKLVTETDALMKGTNIYE